MSVTIQITKKYQSQDRTVLDTQARIQKFFKGGEEENYDRKMFVETHINACTHKS